MKYQLINFIEQHFKDNTIIKIATEFNTERIDMICFVDNNEYHYSLCDIDLYEVKDYDDYKFIIAMLQSNYVRNIESHYRDDDNILEIKIVVEC